MGGKNKVLSKGSTMGMPQLASGTAVAFTKLGACIYLQTCVQ